MAPQQLVEYVKQEIARSTSHEDIVRSLTAHKWPKELIEEALKEVGEALRSGERISFSKNALLGPLELLSAAWSIYKKHVAVLLGILVLPIILALFSLLVIFLFSVVVIEHMLLGSPASFVVLPLFIALILALFYVMVWGQTALLYRVVHYEKPLTIRDSFAQSFKKVDSFAWISALTGLVVLGGFILFIIPGIILAFSLGMASYVFMKEDIKGMDALLKSRLYVKGYWGAVAWRLLVAGFLVGLVQLIPYFGGIASFVLTPLSLIYAYFLFENLRAVKGDIAFHPTKNQRMGYGTLAIVGILIIPLIIFLKFISFS